MCHGPRTVNVTLYINNVKVKKQMNVLIVTILKL